MAQRDAWHQGLGTQHQLQNAAASIGLSSEVAALAFEGCVYFTHLTTLRSLCQQLASCCLQPHEAHTPGAAPQFQLVHFRDGAPPVISPQPAGGSPPETEHNEEDALAVTWRQLAALAQQLLQWMDAEAHLPSKELLDLAHLQPLPPLPTLNGFLLGYPLAYHVTLDTQEAAFRYLTSSSLCLCEVRCPCKLAAASAARQPARGGPAPDVLLSFSLPSSMMDPDQVRALAAAWFERHSPELARHAAGTASPEPHGLWEQAQIVVSVNGPRPTVL